MPGTETTEGQANEPSVQCPRCGYDLEGARMARTEHTETQGRCSECGLVFDWTDVLDPKRDQPRWCVEYADSFFGLIKRSIATVFMFLFLPRRFWRTLKMKHPIKGRTLFGYFVVLLTLGYAWSGVLAGGVFIMETYAYGTSSKFSSELSMAILFPFSMHHSFGFNVSITMNDFYGIHHLVATLGFLFLLPAAFVMLPVSRRRAKVRWEHIWRIAIYSAMYLYAVTMIILTLSVSMLHVSMPIQTLISMAFSLMIFSIIPMATYWWAFATKHYLKMPHALSVSYLMTILALAFEALVVVGWVLMDQSIRL
ncbi:MAG: hypothetical protein O7G85_08705 [Planctomycetota bacterium]|nr:hypothetical protein [Planctomycetota bacterium]